MHMYTYMYIFTKFQWYKNKQDFDNIYMIYILFKGIIMWYVFYIEHLYLNNIAVWHSKKTKEVNKFQLAIKNKEKQTTNN